MMIAATTSWNTDDYEQTFLQKEMINAPQFLKEGDMVEIIFHAEEEKNHSHVIYQPL